MLDRNNNRINVTTCRGLLGAIGLVLSPPLTVGVSRPPPSGSTATGVEGFKPTKGTIHILTTLACQTSELIT